MITIGTYVECKKTKLSGTVIEQEWENGWTYVILTKDNKYFYRNKHELQMK